VVDHPAKVTSPALNKALSHLLEEQQGDIGLLEMDSENVLELLSKKGWPGSSKVKRLQFPMIHVYIIKDQIMNSFCLALRRGRFSRLEEVVDFDGFTADHIELFLSAMQQGSCPSLRVLDPRKLHRDVIEAIAQALQSGHFKRLEQLRLDHGYGGYGNVEFESVIRALDQGRRFAVPRHFRRACEGVWQHH